MNHFSDLQGNIAVKLKAVKMLQILKNLILTRGGR